MNNNETKLISPVLVNLNTDSILHGRDLELSEIIDFLENDIVPVDYKSARKLLVTIDIFYIGQDALEILKQLHCFLLLLEVHLNEWGFMFLVRFHLEGKITGLS